MSGPARPTLLVFDVNETLSDLAPMAGRFEDVGAPGHLATTWFAGLLRDGFALTAVGVNAGFARVAQEHLRTTLAGAQLDRDLDAAVAHVMDGFGQLAVHPDVAAGVRGLSALGLRMVTLSNGSASVAAGLLERAGIAEQFERLLSVEDAPAWKPDARAYAYALDECDVDPQDAMLVAVHPWDIDGAARAGLSTAWVDRTSGPYPAYFAAPDLRVDGLGGLIHRLS